MKKVSSWREGKSSGRKERSDDGKWERGRATKRMKRRKMKNFKLLKPNFTIDMLRYYYFQCSLKVTGCTKNFKNR